MGPTWGKQGNFGIWNPANLTKYPMENAHQILIQNCIEIELQMVRMGWKPDIEIITRKALKISSASLWSKFADLVDIYYINNNSLHQPVYLIYIYIYIYMYTYMYVYYQDSPERISSNLQLISKFKMNKNKYSTQMMAWNASSIKSSHELICIR